MARQDFFLQFGSDAAQFGERLQRDLSGARDTIRELAQEMEQIDRAVEQRGGSQGVSGLVEGLGEANQLVRNLVDSLAGMGDEFRAIAGSLRSAVIDFRRAAEDAPTAPPPGTESGTGRAHSTRVSPAVQRDTTQQEGQVEAEAERLAREYTEISQEIQRAESRLAEITTGSGRARPGFGTEARELRQRLEQSRRHVHGLEEQYQQIEGAYSEGLTRLVQDVSAEAQAPATTPEAPTGQVEQAASQRGQQVRQQVQQLDTRLQETVSRLSDLTGEELERAASEVGIPRQVQVEGETVQLSDDQLRQAVRGVSEQLPQQLNQALDNVAEQAEQATSEATQEVNEAVQDELEGMSFPQLGALAQREGIHRIGTRGVGRQELIERLRDHYRQKDEQVAETVTEADQEIDQAIQEELAQLPWQQVQQLAGRLGVGFRGARRPDLESNISQAREGTGVSVAEAQTMEPEALQAQVAEGGDQVAQGTEALAATSEQLAQAFEVIRQASERIQEIPLDRLGEAEEAMIELNRAAGGRGALNLRAPAGTSERSPLAMTAEMFEQILPEWARDVHGQQTPGGPPTRRILGEAGGAVPTPEGVRAEHRQFGAVTQEQMEAIAEAWRRLDEVTQNNAEATRQRMDVAIQAADALLRAMPQISLEEVEGVLQTADPQIPQEAAQSIMRAMELLDSTRVELGRTAQPGTIPGHRGATQRMEERRDLQARREQQHTERLTRPRRRDADEASAEFLREQQFDVGRQMQEQGFHAPIRAGQATPDRLRELISSPMEKAERAAMTQLEQTEQAFTAAVREASGFRASGEMRQQLEGVLQETGDLSIEDIRESKQAADQAINEILRRYREQLEGIIRLASEGEATEETTTTTRTATTESTRGRETQVPPTPSTDVRTGAVGFEQCCERIVAAINRVNSTLRSGIPMRGEGRRQAPREGGTRRELLEQARQMDIPRRHQMDKGELQQAIEAERELHAQRQASAEATEQASQTERSREIAREELPQQAQELLPADADELMPEEAIERAARFAQAMQDAGYRLDQARRQAGEQFGLEGDDLERVRHRIEAIQAQARQEARERREQSSEKQQGTQAENDLLEYQERILANLSEETREAVMHARQLRAMPLQERQGREHEIRRAQTRAVELMERDFAQREGSGGQVFASARERNVEMRGLLGVGDDEFTDARARAHGERFAERLEQTTERRGPEFQRTMGNAFFGPSGFMGRLMRSTGTFMVRNLSSSLVFGMTRMFRTLLHEALETEAQFIRVSDALEATGRIADGVRTELLRISVDIGRPLEEVYQITSNITGAFEDVRDVEFGTRIVAQLELISQGALTAEAGFDALQTIASAFELEGVRELERIQDTAVAIQNVMAVGIDDTIEGIGGMAGQAAELNFALEETAVLVAAVAKGTNQAGRAAAEQFGRILSTFETQRGRQTLLDVGVGERGMFSEGQIGDVVLDMIESWDDLTEAQQRNIKSTFGARREARAFNALINRREQILQTLIETENAHGLGQQRVEEVMRELANQIRIASTNFTNFGAVLVRSGVLNFFGLLLRTFNHAMSGLNEFLSLLNDIADRNPLLGFARDSMMVLAGLRATMMGVSLAADMMASSMARQAAATGTLQGAMAMPVLGGRIRRHAQQQEAGGAAAGGRRGGAGFMAGAMAGGFGRRQARLDPELRGLRSNVHGRLINEGGRFVGRQRAIDAGLMDPLTGLLFAGGVRGMFQRGASGIGGTLGQFGTRIQERFGQAGTAGRMAARGGAVGRVGAMAAGGAAAAGGGMAKLGTTIAALGPKAWIAAAAIGAVASGFIALNRASDQLRQREESGFGLLQPMLTEETVERSEERRRQEALGPLQRFTERGREAREEEAQLRQERLEDMDPGERALEEAREEAEGFMARFGNQLRGSRQIVTALLSDMGSAVWGGISDWGSDVIDAATNLVPEGVRERVSDAASWISDQASSVAESVSGWVEGLENSLLDWVDESDSAFADGVESLIESTDPGRMSERRYDDERERLREQMMISGHPAREQALDAFHEGLQGMFDIDEDTGEITVDETLVPGDQEDQLRQVERMRNEAELAFQSEAEALERALEEGEINEAEYEARAAALADERQNVLGSIDSLERGVLGLRDIDQLLADELDSFIEALQTIEGIDPRVLPQLEGNLDVLFGDIVPEGSSWERFMDAFMDEDISDAERQQEFLNARRDAMREAERLLDEAEAEGDPEEIEEGEERLRQAITEYAGAQEQLWDEAVSTAQDMAQIAAEVGGGSVEVAEEAIERALDAVREQLATTEPGTPEHERLLQEMRELGQARVDASMGGLERDAELEDARSDDNLASAQRARELAQQRLREARREASRLGLSGDERDAFLHDALIDALEAEQTEADAIEQRAQAELDFATAQTEDPRIQAALRLEAAIEARERYEGDDIERIMELEANILDARREQRDAIDRVAQAEMQLALSETRDPREEALIRLRAAVEARGRYTGDDPAEIASREAEVNQAEQDLLDQARAERDARAQTQIAMERDPETRLLMEMQLARVQLAEAAEQGRAAYEEARQNLIQLEQALEDERNAIRMAQFQTRIQTTEDPLVQARLQIEQSREEMRQASGQQERLAAHQSIIAARQAEADAISAIAEAQLDLAQAIAQAHGDQIEVARIQLEAARRRLQEARTRGEGEAAIAQARAQIIQAESQMRDAVLQDHLDTIEFNREMGVITQGEAIEALQTILAEMDLTREQRRNLLRQIQGLQDNLRAQLTGSGFNIPTEIDLPTAYMVRRSLGIDEMRTDRVPDEFSDLTRPTVDIDDDLTEPLSDYEDAVIDTGDRVIEQARTDARATIDAILDEYAGTRERFDDALAVLAESQEAAWRATQETAGRGAADTNQLTLDVISELPPELRSELEALESEQRRAWEAAEDAADVGSRRTVEIISENLAEGVDDVAEIVQGFSRAIADGINPVLSALGEPEIEVSRRGGGGSGTIRAMAKGGFTDEPLPSNARIEPPHGTNGMVQWAEHSTHGEAFIPLSPGNRPRSIRIWEEAGRRLGVDQFARGGIGGGGDIEFEPRTGGDRRDTDERLQSFAEGGLRSPNFDRTHGGTVHYGGWTTNLAPYVIADIVRILNRTPGGQGISSAYRSPEHNRRVGGARDSDHMYGHAVDIIPLGAQLDQAINQFRQLPGVRWISPPGMYRSHRHVSWNRRGFRPDHDDPIRLDGDFSGFGSDGIFVDFPEIPDTPEGLLGDVGQMAMESLRDSALDYVRENFAFGLGLGATGEIPSGALQDMVKQRMLAFGFGEEHWPALANLIQRESSWNPTAQNPTSTAFGLFQFLDSTWGGTGIPKTSDPGLQTEAGLRYIQARYGDPTRAWQHWLARVPINGQDMGHWYRTGGIFDDPSIIGVGEAGPEAVIPLDQRGARFMAQLMDETAVSSAARSGAMEDSDVRQFLRDLGRQVSVSGDTHGGDTRIEIENTFNQTVSSPAMVEQVARKVVDLLGKQMSGSARSLQSTPHLVRSGG